MLREGGCIAIWACLFLGPVYAFLDVCVDGKNAGSQSCGSVRIMKGDRQRLMCVPSHERPGLIPSVAVGMIGLCAHTLMYPGVVNAAMWPNLLFESGSEHGIQLGLEHAVAVVPPFRAAPRDRTSALVDAQWRPSVHVRIDGSWSWIRDQLPAGMAVGGPGDIRLGTHALLWNGPVSFGMGWAVKLPNARDEGELGSDETDALVQATVAKSWGSVTIMSGAGVVIQGDPIRFANQDDAGLLWAGMSGTYADVHWFSQVGGTMATTRNPARIVADIGASYGCPVSVGGGATVGMTAASPIWGGNLLVGFGLGCD